MAIAPTPSGRQSVWLLPAVALGYAGAVTAYLPLLSLLLPMKVAAVAGAARLGVLTAAVLAGAVAASLSNILFGALSDRSVARGGGRRRWLAGGVVATGASYAGIAAADTPALIVVAIAAFQFAVNALLAPLMAMVADEVPDARKGLAGGLLALGAPAASGVGVLLVGAASLGPAARLAAISLVSAGCIGPLFLLRPVIVAQAPRTRAAQAGRRNLLIAWAARLLVQAAGAVLANYLLFYFESIAAGEQSAGVAQLLLLASLLPLPVAVAAGRWSDRSGQRTPVLFAAAAVAAAGLGGMALAQGRAAGALAFLLYGVGAAVFLALHAGFAMRLLPDPRRRGRDLGLLNLTNTLPLLLGPLLAWSLATPQDFAPLMLVLSALTATGGTLMLAVGRPQRGSRHQRT